ncbi:MAG TPA: A24 family peptidase [Abditibacteriaceae bacterium]|jgi:prepilin peptidase CpaA
MSYYLSRFTGQTALGLNTTQVWTINAVLIAVLIICFVTDWKKGKILNVVTFPAMLAGLLLNGLFGQSTMGDGTGFLWALLGWAVGMGIQWVPFMLGFAKAGDVKLLAAVGALKGWSFCLFGFLYGAIAFSLLLPWLAKKGELSGVVQNIKTYAQVAVATQGAPETPQPTVKRHLPWGPGLVVGFFIALLLELTLGKPFWFF